MEKPEMRHKRLLQKARRLVAAVDELTCYCREALDPRRPQVYGFKPAILKVERLINQILPDLDD